LAVVAAFAESPSFASLPQPVRIAATSRLAAAALTRPSMCGDQHGHDLAATPSPRMPASWSHKWSRLRQLRPSSGMWSLRFLRPPEGCSAHGASQRRIPLTGWAPRVPRQRCRPGRARVERWTQGGSSLATAHAPFSSFLICLASQVRMFKTCGAEHCPEDPSRAQQCVPETRPRIASSRRPRATAARNRRDRAAAGSTRAGPSAWGPWRGRPEALRVRGPWEPQVRWHRRRRTSLSRAEPNRRLGDWRPCGRWWWHPRVSTTGAGV